MAEKADMTKNDDIQDIKRVIKYITILMKSFVDNMKKLHDRMDCFEEDMDMEISNLRKTVDCFEEDMDMVEILGDEISNLRNTVADMKMNKQIEQYEQKLINL